MSKGSKVLQAALKAHGYACARVYSEKTTLVNGRFSPHHVRRLKAYNIYKLARDFSDRAPIAPMHMLDVTHAAKAAGTIFTSIEVPQRRPGIVNVVAYFPLEAGEL